MVLVGNEYGYIIIVLFIGFSIGLLCSFTSGIGGMLGPQFVGPLMQGYALSFVLVGLIRLLCLLVLPGQSIEEYFASTILYFTLNIVLLTSMAISIPVMLHLVFIKLQVFFRNDYISAHMRRDSRAVDDFLSEISHNGVVVSKIFRKIWFECAVLCISFLMTYMLYPSIVYQKSKEILADREDWSIFIINISFAVIDFLGRTLGKIRSSYSRSFLGASTLVSMIFVATTFIIALSDEPFWNSGITIIVNCSLLGFTNGFFATAACNTIPGKLEIHEKEFGGFVMTVMINGGIAIGSLISLLAFSNLFSH